MSTPSIANTTHPSSASAQSKEMRACSGNHSVRLEVGAGDFSFIYALEKKLFSQHENIGHSLISTDVRDVTKDCINCEGRQALFEDENLRCNDCPEIEERKKYLREKGITILTGIDATKLHEDDRIKKLFEEKGPISRIFWNFPHNGSSVPSEEMPELMYNWFRSCSKLFRKQGIEGGKVYITVGQPSEKKGWYQAGIHNLCYATYSNGFVLKTVRKFASRYLEYKHRETARAQSNSVADEGRQFVFQHILSRSEDKNIKKEAEKRNTSPIVICVERYALPKIACSVNCVSMNNGEIRDFYEYTTDPDSTDYSTEEESKEPLIHPKVRKLRKHSKYADVDKSEGL